MLGGVKLGLHVGPCSTNDPLLGVLKRAQARGNPVRYLTLLGPGNPSIKEWKTASPGTFILYRHYYDTGGAEYFPPGGWAAADVANGEEFCRDFFGSYIDGNADLSYADAFQLHNEPNVSEDPKGMLGLIAWTLGTVREAKRRGRKLAVLNFSPGAPALPSDKSDGKETWETWLLPEMHVLLREVRDAGMVVDLHQGSDPAWDNPFLSTRHRKVLAALPPDLQDLRFVFGEFGSLKLRDMPDPQIKTLFEHGIGLFRGDPNAIGAGCWYYRVTKGWDEDELAGHLGAYEMAIGSATLATRAMFTVKQVARGLVNAVK